MCTITLLLRNPELWKWQLTWSSKGIINSVGLPKEEIGVHVLLTVDSFVLWYT